MKFKTPTDVTILYEDGNSEEANLNQVRWRVVTEENAANFVANMSIAPPPPGISELEKFEKSGALKDTTDSQTHACPKTYRDIHKMKPAQQEAWFKSNDKEFETLIKKGALRIIDTRHIPRDAIFVPT